MTKRHFQAAAEQVRAIRDGDWTDELPTWAQGERLGCSTHVDNYERAVLTAEAYILLFSRFNPRFNQQTFLVACGLLEAPAKGKRRSA